MVPGEGLLKKKT